MIISDTMYGVFLTLIVELVIFVIWQLIQKKRFSPLMRISLALSKELAASLVDGRITPKESKRITDLFHEFLETIYSPPEDEEEKDEQPTFGGAPPPLKE